MKQRGVPGCFVSNRPGHISQNGVKSKWKLLSCVQLFEIPWTIQSMGFSRPEYGSGWPFPSLGDLPNPGIDPGLLYCRRILYQLSHQGSPRILEWVVYPFSSRSSQPRNQTGVSCIAGRFFTNWAIRKAQYILWTSLWKKNESEIAQSCPTLCDPIDCSLPGSSIQGIFQARVLEWVAISFSRGSSWPRDRTRVSHIVGRRFTVWATRETYGPPFGPP